MDIVYEKKDKVKWYELPHGTVICDADGQLRLVEHSVNSLYVNRVTVWLHLFGTEVSTSVTVISGVIDGDPGHVMDHGNVEPFRVVQVTFEDGTPWTPTTSSSS